MNRRIKFRIWNRKTNSWIHGPHERADLDGVNLFGENILLGNLLDGVSIEDLNEVEALQFTGKKDVNGKEIFEGDILRAKDRTHCQYIPVTYDDYRAAFLFESRTAEDFFRTNRVEVAGNIFENADLLK